jgi:hypothetical protein
MQIVSRILRAGVSIPSGSAWLACGTTLLLLNACAPAEKVAGQCMWRPLPLAAVQADRKFYAGQGKRVSLRFANDRTDSEPEVFPEGPLRIDGASGGSCEIPPGDIRVRNSVHLSSDEGSLLLLEYSGSNDSIVLYETTSCHQLAKVDVSGSKWALQPQGLVVGTNCSGDAVTSCSTTNIYEFSDDCHSVRTSRPATAGAQ